jgi:hypothetical protein
MTSEKKKHSIQNESKITVGGCRKICMKVTETAKGFRLRRRIRKTTQRPLDQSKMTLKRKKQSKYNESKITLGGCRKICMVPDIVKAAKKYPMVVFHSTDPCHPLYDFMYRSMDGTFHEPQALNMRRTLHH